MKKQLIAFVLGLSLWATPVCAATLVKDTDTVYVMKGRTIRLKRKKKRKFKPKKNKKITLKSNGKLKAKKCGTTMIEGPSTFTADVVVFPKKEACKVRPLEKSTVLSKEDREDFAKLKSAMERNQSGEVVELHNLSNAVSLWHMFTGDTGICERNIASGNSLCVQHFPANQEYATGKCGCYGAIEETYGIVKSLGITHKTSKRDALIRILTYIGNQSVYDRDRANQIAEGAGDIVPTQRFDGILHEGKGVCSAYSQLFQILCVEVGIPCDLVRGYLDGGYHQWNRISLRGKIYVIDPTVQDQTLDSKKPKLERRDYSIEDVLSSPSGYSETSSVEFGPKASEWYYNY